MTNIYKKPQAEISIKVGKDSKVTYEAIDSVCKAKGWANFIAILVFILFLVHIAIAIIVFIKNKEKLVEVEIYLSILFFILMSFVLFGICTSFFKYNSSIKSLIKTESIQDFSNCFLYFKKMHKFIFIYIMLSIIDEIFSFFKFNLYFS